MNLYASLLGLALALAAPAHAAEGGLADDPLTTTIAALDTASFDAFNHCDRPGELERYASYFADDLEFYHDQGGVTWTREDMIANTRKYVCGHFRRELVPGSLRVYPVKDFGAIEQGAHTFCQFDSGKCEGIADFIIVWRQRDKRWEATRVLSYGHRENPAASGAVARPQQSRAAALRSELDASVPLMLKEKQVASVSIARIEAGQVLLTAAYGNQATDVPATPATLYNIASMAKPVSAEVALRLAAAHRLSLDEPMASTWTDPDIANDGRRTLLTPRLALSHRSGFPNWRYETDGKLRFLRRPGTGFGYSGEGFEYLARFIEKKTGESFEALAQSLVFDPTAMHDAAYTRRRWFDGRIALPTGKDGAELEPQIADKPIASDDLYTTPADYAKFIVSLIRHEGVDEAIANERKRIHTDRTAELCPPARKAVCPEAAGFGLGWEVFRFDDATYLMHTGMDNGVFTLGYFDPESGSGTVIFTNSANGPQVVLPILDVIGRDEKLVAFLREIAK
ncbi:serine hydrolase [Aerolutibacter daejeonensis]|uniref:serine hydrolase n=1 Tax=Aerolutibacter daejeonensis TaxID=346181 RepID=UPI00068E8AF6